MQPPTQSLTEPSEQLTVRSSTFAHLPRRPLVDIEFQDLTFTVPQGRKGSKIILRSVNGYFRAGQLHAILGPSGAGKSTLLNILAGYKCTGATGNILINGEPRNLQQFSKMSRYIMQENLIQPMLTVDEIMLMAANLKLGTSVSADVKRLAIDEILDTLRLDQTKNTTSTQLSGGEQKRLSVALELLNNPSILFLDEPTTGLDDLSCSQCVNLLKQLASEGRTVICSIHTPSAKLFSIFDNAYVLSGGQCTYQGYGPDVINFLNDHMGIVCPTTYNPADFVIELCCGEYGDFQDRLVSLIENGRIAYRDRKLVAVLEDNSNTSSVDVTTHHNCSQKTTTKPKIDPDLCEQKPSDWCEQFCILLARMWKQMWRDKSYLMTKVCIHILVGLLVGNIYIGMGNDGSKTIFNFGFFFTCIIFFMYVPMMPTLLTFPMEIQHVKREHFNKWYRLSSYFCALTVSTLPIQILLSVVYLSMVYVFTDQPLELHRFLSFYLVCILTSFVSESFGLLIGSTLNVVNSVFVAPVMSVPFMVLATYGFGEGYSSIPLLIRISMQFSYLRYSLEAIIGVMFRGRAPLKCPDEEEFCLFTDLEKFVVQMGMDKGVLWLDVVVLILFFFAFRGASYYLLRQRLTPNKTFVALQYIGRFVKSQFSLGR